MRGYKAFDKDLKCRDMQYEVGKTYEIKGELKICKNGFHYCETIADCYEYYPQNDNTRICEVEAIGNFQQDDNKYCTDKITIVRELSKEEHKNGNIGNNNIGYSNKGDLNIGNYNIGSYNNGNNNKGNSNKGKDNTGDYNIGEFNRGDHNEGNSNIGGGNKGGCNKGHYNKGHYNIGNGNQGNRNKGDSNTGDQNEGDYNMGFSNEGTHNIGYDNKGDFNIGIANVGNYQIGVACTNAPLMLFNKPSKHSLKELWVSGVMDDIIGHKLTARVKALDTFDINVWNDLVEEKKEWD